MKLEMTNKEKIETLEKQIRDLEEEIEKLRVEESEPRYPSFEFEFDETGLRHYQPYVAKMRVDHDNTLYRNFFDFDREYGDKEVSVHGYYFVEEGDIVEIRRGGLTSNKREFYLITEKTEQDNHHHYLGSFVDSRVRMDIKKYLRGDLLIEDILKQ